MTTIIAIIALVISICAIYEIEKLKKNDVKNIEKEIKETDRIKNILAGLKQCDCELIVKETMFLIVSMGRKTISRMIRITMIKDVIELTK